MRYRCTTCELEFEAGEARCPRCLRQSSVLPADDPRAAGVGEAAPARAAGGRRGALGVFGLVVAVAVITPFVVMNSIAWRLGWWFTFVVAVGGFGLGHLLQRVADDRDR